MFITRKGLCNGTEDAITVCVIATGTKRQDTHTGRNSVKIKTEHMLHDHEGKNTTVYVKSFFYY